MKLYRMFSTDKDKGTRDYLNSQKKYEIMRTVLYFLISLLLFIAGWITTKSRLNLLTIVAILGCLPASKSAVGMIMYLRCNSCLHESAEKIDAHIGSLCGLYDLYFTSYQTNYRVDHLVVKGNTICGFTQDLSFEEQKFTTHITDILKAENLSGVSVKIFTSLDKYLERLDQLNLLQTEEKNTIPILNTIKNVTL